jgi:hypothetical protein
VKKTAIIFTLTIPERRKTAMKSLPEDTSPSTQNFTVARRYLTEREVERLMDTARKVSRHRSP